MTIKNKIRLCFTAVLLITFLSVHWFYSTSPTSEVRYVRGILPVFIQYYTTPNSPCGDERADGCQRGIFVYINTDYYDAEALLTHELIHIDQFYRSFFISSILYLTSEKCRAWLEAEAYAANVVEERDILVYAVLIHEEYSPSVSIKTIESHIRHFIEERKE